MKNKKGFTLIELLVVIAIIGLLSSLAVVSLNNARNKAQDARVKSDLKQVSTAMELFFSEDGVYPGNGAAPGACLLEANAMTDDVDDTANPDAMCCGSGTDLTTTVGTPQLILNAIPCHPVSTSNYVFEGNGTSYCVSGDLPQAGGYFTCSVGSCFENASQCTEVP